MEMPNTKPPALDRESLEAKYSRAAETSAVNYAFYMGASNDNLEAIRSLDPKAAPGIKVFMGASTGNMLVDNPETLDAIFRDAPTPIITHCEDTPMIDANHAKAREKYGDNIPAREHPLIRSREACIKSTRWRFRWRRSTAPACMFCTSPPPTNWRCSSPARSKARKSPPKPACISCISTMTGLRTPGFPDQVQSGDQNGGGPRSDHQGRRRKSHRRAGDRSRPALAGRKSQSFTTRRRRACRWCSTRCRRRFSA
jgi:hypothetical protein